MSLSIQAQVELMAFADGELDTVAQARVRALLETDAEARAMLEELRRDRIGPWLEMVAAERAASARADGTADAVMRRLGGGVAKTANVRRLGYARRWGVMLGAAVALAAAALLVVRSSHRPGASVVAETPVAPPLQGAGVEVDNIDSPSRGVSVFEIPARGASAAVGASPSPSSVVIWIDDEPAGGASP